MTGTDDLQQDGKCFADGSSRHHSEAHLRRHRCRRCARCPARGCGSDGGSSSNNNSASSAPAPKPVSVIDALSGESTAIALGEGFTDALTALQLTPGVTGGD